MSMQSELDLFTQSDWMAVIGCLMQSTSIKTFKLTPELWDKQRTDDSCRHMLVKRLDGGGIEISFCTPEEAAFFRQSKPLDLSELH